MKWGKSRKMKRRVRASMSGTQASPAIFPDEFPERLAGNGPLEMDVEFDLRNAVEPIAVRLPHR